MRTVNLISRHVLLLIVMATSLMRYAPMKRVEFNTS
jgi:hypothetical protein